MNERVKTREGFSKLVQFLVLFAVLALLAAVAIPNFVKARGGPHRAYGCFSILRQIDGAKDQWALENKKSVGTPVVASEVDAYIKSGAPKCPNGGTYTYGAVGETPKCSIPGHTL